MNESITNELYVEIYKMLQKMISHISSAAGIDGENLEKYYVPEAIYFNQNYLRRLASSIQNSGMMHNSIKFNGENFEHIRTKLYNFDVEESLKNYSSYNELYNAFTNFGTMDKGMKNTKETNWERYSKGIFDGLVFLGRENGKEKIEELIKLGEGKEFSKKFIDVIEEIQSRIHGLGFALTCDWLKECGCTWLAKPDIHINEVYKSIVNKEKFKDYDVMKFMFNWAEILKNEKVDEKISAYKLDKIIWLNCTGNFYLNDTKIGRDMIVNGISKILK